MTGEGADYDQDGCQDSEDDDTDGDGVADANEEDHCVMSNPPTLQGETPNDYDGDGCLGGGYWTQDESDEWYCFSGNCEDDDDDDDGALDGEDIDDSDEFVCSDNDGDGCEDCGDGSYGLDDDGPDDDGDGFCNAGDLWPNCPNVNDGEADGEAWAGENPYDECGICNGPGLEDGFNCDGVPADFAYNLSSEQAFYYVSSIQNMYGNEIDSTDWLGVFNGNICVGSREWNTNNCSGGVCDLPAMGDDFSSWSNTAGYLLEGDEPSFKLYDVSEGKYFDVSPLSAESFGFASFGTFEISELSVREGYDINLFEHMNLISFYALPEDRAVSVVMDGLGSSVSAVFGEAASTINNAGTWQGTLLDADISSGYWVRMSGNANLSGSGFPYNINREYNLNAGANLVSFPSMGSFDLSMSLPDDIEGNIKAISGQGSAAIYSNAIGGWAGTLTRFDGGKGYWIFTDAPIDFSYEVDPGDMLSRTVAPQLAEAPSGLEFIQSSEQAFYFLDASLISEVSAVPGDWFVSFCGTSISGSRQYQGELIDIPVMGYDGHHSTAGYCEAGDKPQFKLFKPVSSEMIDLYSDTPAWESNGIVMMDNLSEAAPVPAEFSMLSAYPNPFNPVTNIGFEIPQESMVQISVYDIQGQEVETLVNEITAAGMYNINWNANDVASGVYFVHLTAAADGSTPITQIQKLMLIKQ